MEAAETIQETPAGLRVLVLDDEQPVRRLIEAVLTRAGWTVETACDGREGLDILLQKPFDVLVVDLRMKGMDGLAFLEEARKIWPWLGVVILSGFVDHDSITRADRLGVTRILEKPIEPEMLRQSVLDEALARKEQLALEPQQHSPEQIRYQLGMLRHLGESAIAGQSLIEALRNLSAGLTRLLPCSLVGILGMEKEEHILALNIKESVSKAFVEHIRQEMLARFRALSGRSVADHAVQLRTEGVPPAETGPARAGSLLIVPVITEGQLHGLLALAASAPGVYSATDVSFLYHAANQLSTVMVSLNKMQQLAIRDPLTALYNRRHLEEVIEQSWLLVNRYDLDMSLAIVDVDHFKPLNDTHGHLAGDEVLREFASLIQSVSRASDTVARYGGDEFIVILPKASEQDARAFAERLLLAVRGHVFCERSLKLRRTCTIGIAGMRTPKPPVSSGELIERADAALYEAKRAGRNRYALWSRDVAAPRAETPAAPAAAEAAAPARARILLVDDEESILRLLSRILAAEGYQADAASTASEALRRLKETRPPYDVLLTDLHLQEQSGIDLMQAAQLIDGTLVRIAITGQATVDNAVASLRSGAYDFIEKPINREHLLAVLRRALEYRRLVRENERYQLHLEDMVREKSAALTAALDETRQSYDFALEAMVAMVDAREHATGAHSKRVRDLTLILAREMKVTGDAYRDIAHGALLHDIGKIAVPDAILLKPGPLTPEEWTLMRMHPETGHRLLSGSAYLQRAAEIVLSHHERFDGTGYPRGLRGEEICPGARIFAVVDAYDAIRSTRVYRAAQPMKHAVEEIARCSGTHFDPCMVEAFMRCCPLIEEAGGWEKN